MVMVKMKKKRLYDHRIWIILQYEDSFIEFRLFSI